MLNFFNQLKQTNALPSEQQNVPQLITNEQLENLDLWLAYCYFHNNQQDKSEEIYKKLLKNKDAPKETLQLFIAVCKLYEGDLNGAINIAKDLPATALQNRLLFHASARSLNEKSLVQYHSKLQNTPADQLALAAVHYLRTHFQQAIDCYSQTATEHQDFYSLCVFRSFCYYQLQDFNRALQELQQYRENVEDSVSSVNLLAAIEYKSNQQQKAFKTLSLLKICQNIETQPVYQHNNAIYGLDLNDSQSVQKAVNILLPLQMQVTEARGNLIYLLIKQQNYKQAFDILQSFQPATSQEYILKAAVCAYYGLQFQDPEALKYARAAYFTVGDSPADKDSVLGRLAAAAASFLDGAFEEAELCYNSIKNSQKIDEVSYDLNYGMTLAALAQDEEAGQLLMKHSSDQQFTIIHYQWLVRILIRAGKYQEVDQLLQNITPQVNIRTLQLFRVLVHEYFAVNEFDRVIDCCKQGLECCGDLEEFLTQRQEFQLILRSAMAARQLKQRGKKVVSQQMIFEEEES